MAELSYKPISTIPDSILSEDFVIRLANYKYPDDISAALNRQDGFIIPYLVDGNNNPIVFRYLPSAIEFAKKAEKKFDASILQIEGFCYAD